MIAKGFGRTRRRAERWTWEHRSWIYERAQYEETKHRQSRPLKRTGTRMIAPALPSTSKTTGNESR